ncbi:hypothetical protein [Pseudalkalibacillus sp. SCS-8]|uniref:hypothetical protein n=1 Tax=Pseudalkalibacillus nanhaiensis TaxID=3115291 RepID=UPI0032DB920B
MKAESMNDSKTVTQEELAELRKMLDPLIGVQFDILAVPESVLLGLEPSQVGTMVGTLMDSCIPVLHTIPTTEQGKEFPNIGITKHDGILGNREGYPDFLHESGKRLELKLLFVDNPEVKMKKPPTPREPSARLTQKVTVKNVIPDRDVLLVLAYQLEENKQRKGYYSPTIMDIGLFPVIECINARDKRMEDCGGRWFGNYDTPTILSRIGKEKLKKNEKLNFSTYGRKEEEGLDFNEDTNFGKLKRIPYLPLQKFIALHKQKN